MALTPAEIDAGFAQVMEEHHLRKRLGDVRHPDFWRALNPELSITEFPLRVRRERPAATLDLTESAQRLKASTLEIRRGDGVAALRQAGAATLDLVFLDPPFAGDLFEPALKAAHAAVKPGGWVYLEAPKAWSEADLAACGYALSRQTKAGQVWAHLLSIA